MRDRKDHDEECSKECVEQSQDNKRKMTDSYGLNGASRTKSCGCCCYCCSFFIVMIPNWKRIRSQARKKMKERILNTKKIN